MMNQLFEAMFGRSRRTDRILDGLREPMWKSGGDTRRATLDEAIKRVEAERNPKYVNPNPEWDAGKDAALAILRQMRDEP